MPNFIIRVTRPVERTAEYEYIKEFFRFIGYLVTDHAVDDQIQGIWAKALVPDEKSDCIHIVMNAAEDPHLDLCRQLGIRRIHCHADFNLNMMCGSVVEEPSEPVSQAVKNTNKRLLRQNLLLELIDSIWDDGPVKAEILAIANAYLNLQEGELFYFLQSKRNLRVLVMGEVLKERTAQVSRIMLVSYVKSCVTALWEMHCRIADMEGLHSRYARVNLANKIYEIIAKLYDTDRPGIAQICYTRGEQKIPCAPPPVSALLQELEAILEQAPTFISAYLLMANIYGTFLGRSDAEDQCYKRLWRAIPRSGQDYAFIWYRNAYFYEKRKKDRDKALDFYRYAVQLNPDTYQAWFKLGYYAAADKHYDQAEVLLRRMIQSVFRGRSTDPDASGAYSNWLALSTKECQYVYKAYILLAKIAFNRNQENAVKTYIGRACMAATRFEEATVVRQVSHFDGVGYEANFIDFLDYHQYSTPVWAMWQVLSPWTENVIQDFFVRDIVRSRLRRWKQNKDNP